MGIVEFAPEFIPGDTPTYVDVNINNLPDLSDKYNCSTTLEEYVEFRIEEYNTFYKKHTILTSEGSTLSNNPAHIIKTSFSLTPSYSTISSEVFTVKDCKLHRVTYNTNEEEYNQYKAIGNHMISTFEILQ